MASMDGKELFAIWSPPESIWSAWAKPVAFTIDSFTPVEVGGEGLALPDVSAWSAGARETALIVDVPDVRSVMFGLALAERGFRPVPLFNAVDSRNSVVKVSPIRGALEAGADLLRKMRLPPDAPPAFLLDSNRLEGRAEPGEFDNRWVVFPQDFPSGAFLQAHGIRRVIVLRASYLQRDLVWLLSVWKRGGLEILDAEVHDGTGTEQGGAPVVPYEAEPLSRFSLMRTAFVFMLLASLGLRRSSAGGFGSAVPIPSRGG
ncbi:MAG: hypothetical protein JNL42_00490 [Anaerolineae bacterium]|nr:hypothetical protein [Anaerolineae bacterium]